MFLGEYSHSLDGKGRLTIPARFRGQLEDGMVISRGPDLCLVIYPQNEWRALSETLGQLPRTHKAVRSYNRLMFSGAAEASLDSMGRILIPAFLREHAQIDQDAVIVGANSVIEIWNPEVWRQTFAQDAEDLEGIMASVANLGV